MAQNTGDRLIFALLAAISVLGNCIATTRRKYAKTAYIPYMYIHIKGLQIPKDAHGYVYTNVYFGRIYVCNLLTQHVCMIKASTVVGLTDSNVVMHVWGC